MTECTLHIPSFLDDYVLSTSDKSLLSSQSDVLKKKDWLTAGLTDEVRSMAPARDEIKRQNDNERDKEAFERNAAQLFPKGRQFASYTQLVQATKMFLDSWATQGVHEQKRIVCHYSESRKKKKTVALSDATNRQERNIAPSMKTQCKCPFQTRHSFVDYRVDPALGQKNPPIYYRVQITGAVCQHTCDLNTIFHRKAKQSGGQLQPDLSASQGIIEQLRDKPRKDAADLRVSLMKHLPMYTDIDAKFVCNFRQRVQHYLLNSPEGQTITIDKTNFF